MKKKTIFIGIVAAILFAGCGAKQTQESSSAEVNTKTEEAVSTENTVNTTEAADDESIEGTTQNSDTGEMTEEQEETSWHIEANPDCINLELKSKTDLNTNSDGQIIAYVRYPYFEQAENTDSFEALNKSLDSYNIVTENKVGDVLNDLTSYAEFDAQQGRDVVGDSAYSTTMDDYVMRSDRNIVSILEYTYYYAGGAHPVTSFGCANFDPETGERLHIQDVVSDADTLSEKIASALEEKYSDILGGMLLDGELETTIEKMIFPVEANGGIDVVTGQEVNSDDAQLPFTLDNEGITFWFSPYSIAVYAAGSQTVTFSFDEYPDLVKSEYTQTADEYIVPLVQGINYSVAAGKGTTDLCYYTAPNEYGDSVLTIIIDGTNHTYNDMGMVSNPYLYLVKTNRKDYLYYVYDAEDACGAIACIDPSNITGDLSDMRYADAWPSGRALVDPGHLTLERRCDFLSTYFTECNYAVGEDGLPVRIDKWDIIGDVNYNDVETVLTLKCDLDVTTVDENGSETGTITLHKGDRLSFLRTDGESWVDMKNDNGDICRIRPVIDTEGNGPWETVNGKDINDIFDGMIFAG